MDSREREILTLREAFARGRLSRRNLIRKLVRLGVPAAVALTIASSPFHNTPAGAAPPPTQMVGRHRSPGLSAAVVVPPPPANLRTLTFTRPSPRPSICVVVGGSSTASPMVSFIDHLGTSFAAFPAGGRAQPLTIPRTHALANRQDMALEVANLGSSPVDVSLRTPGGAALTGTVAPMDAAVWRPWQGGFGRVTVATSRPVAGFGYAL